jgi:hypothetical protein
VSAFYDATAHIEGRRDPAFHAQRIGSDRCAHNIDNGINRADFVKLDGLHILVMDLCFHFTERLENRCCRLFGGIRYRGLPNNLADLFQPAVRMLMPVRVLMSVAVLMGVAVLMVVLMSMFERMSMLVLMIVLIFPLLQELFPGQIFLAIDQHVNLGRGDSVAVHVTDVQRGSDVQAANRFQQQLCRNSGRDERAQKHVAADPRKAI